MAGQDQQKTQVLFGTQSSDYTTSATPETELYSVNTIDISPDTTRVRDRGLGEGKDPVNHIRAQYQDTGTIEFNPVSLDFLKFAYGYVTGSGTQADPYVLNAAESIGTGSQEIPIATILQQNLTPGEKTLRGFIGAVGQNMTLSFQQGELVSAQIQVHAREDDDNFSEKSYATRTEEPYQMIGATIEFGNPLEDAGLVRSASISVDNDLNVNGSRPNYSTLLEEPPTVGQRQHQYSLQVVYNDSVKDRFLNALRGASDGVRSQSGDPVLGSGVEFKILCQNGSGRQAVFHLTGCSVDNVTDPRSVGGGNVVSTVSGQALGPKNGELITWY